MDEATAQMILDTTPEEVYRILRGYDRNLYVDPGNGFNCPLHHYFCDALMMEPDDVQVGMESIRLGYRGGGEFDHLLPQWMNDYQEALFAPPRSNTMGECLDVLANMYHEECLVVDEEEEDEPEEIGSVEECIAQLEASYGTDRDPVSSAIYYLQLYADSLKKKGNG
jgi:hypothetical protein